MPEVSVKLHGYMNNHGEVWLGSLNATAFPRLGYKQPREEYSQTATVTRSYGKPSHLSPSIPFP